ncbi:MAG: (2Fe-2S) ferredoxin domain-containing protein [Candidatus Omnitrophica bacterium]|nr:(2Fe-2S) ferredoxin domain-containing protein [Candidatus Omnitrophota bacterium]
MKKPEYHIFVCNSFRLTGEPQGVCNKKNAANLLRYLEEEIIDRGIDGMVSGTSCLKFCEKGPIMVIYPHNHWYSEVNEELIDNVLDSIEEGKLLKSNFI